MWMWSEQIVKMLLELMFYYVA